MDLTKQQDTFYSGMDSSKIYFGSVVSKLDHVLRLPPDAPIYRCKIMVSEGVKKGRGRPKNTRKGVIPKDLQSLVIM